MYDDVELVAMVSDLTAMISEVNLVGSNASEWWVDTGNSATSEIKGEGGVVLKMTSRKELKLKNVLFVLEVRKNLVSGWLLNKFGFRLVFESDKFLLTKSGMFVGKDYAFNGVTPTIVLRYNIFKASRVGTQHYGVTIHMVYAVNIALWKDDSSELALRRNK
ncbi:hypothetical protein Tco_1324781, partial [Tanacetum coccineum]